MSGPFRIALSVVAALTGVRVLVLFAGGLELHGDEAQYWVWSTQPDWGYFSKPPMIAWAIAATSALGEGDAFVRLSAPLFHGATALLLHVLAANLFTPRVGAWTAVAYATLPAVTYSSALISTDVPLLFFWALGLVAFERLLASGRVRWSLLLGIALGLGMLSKYAMGYFVIGIAGTLLLNRRVLGTPKTWHLLVALLVAGLCLVPNILWNMDHGWVTAGHTAANANWDSAFKNLGKGVEFAGAQVGVFGPVLMAALAWRLAAWRRDPPGDAERMLLAFSLPVLVLVTAQAFVSRAHANWAATAYVAATPLVVSWLLRAAPRLLSASTALHGLVFAVAALILSGAVTLPLSRDPLDRLRGWRAFAAEVRSLAETRSAEAILVHDRLMAGPLIRYLPDPPAPVRVWPGDAAVHNHYELTIPLTPEDGRRVLYLTEAGEQTSIPFRARTIEATGTFQVPLTDGRSRGFSWYLLADFQAYR